MANIGKNYKPIFEAHECIHKAQIEGMSATGAAFAQTLLYFLNRSRWEQPFVVADAILRDILHINDKTLRKHRKEIVDFGLFTFNAGVGRGNMTSYLMYIPLKDGTLYNLLGGKDTRNDTQKGILKGVLKGGNHTTYNSGNYYIDKACIRPNDNDNDNDNDFYKADYNNFNTKYRKKKTQIDWEKFDTLPDFPDTVLKPGEELSNQDVYQYFIHKPEFINCEVNGIIEKLQIIAQRFVDYCLKKNWKANDGSDIQQDWQKYADIFLAKAMKPKEDSTELSE
ncbi:MAG TPA: hypothetical protein P5531_06320 [Bacteroidales bacterium]|nr:hypothetical protein [Bacteroidales bacterium]HSA43748.1 hypothetical protein [Bacteroidales bacterium]